MRLSTKGRYAVMAMADLAKRGGDQAVTLGEIATRQDISLPYLEQLDRDRIVHLAPDLGVGVQDQRDRRACFLAGRIATFDPAGGAGQYDFRHPCCPLLADQRFGRLRILD